MIDRKQLLADLKKQVAAAETDLTKQVAAVAEVGERLRAEYDLTSKYKFTASTWTQWRDERVTQAAVAWVLGTVFVRFCEDNGLLKEPYLAGPTSDRLMLAQERQDDYLSRQAALTNRDWLLAAFEDLGAGQAGQLLFDADYHPLYQIPMSHDAARDLIGFWRARTEDGSLVHDFTDDAWGTRFLGDLYQDLSEDAKKTYALLQTPEFVEEFILDRTLKPAIGEFGLDVVKMIDPTCGSGHFLLGAFHKLYAAWADKLGELDRYKLVHHALDAVHGVDLNPFAASIARFRLLVAALRAAEFKTLDEANERDWPIHVAISDSLIRDESAQADLFGDDQGWHEAARFVARTDDREKYPKILQEGRYHVVVGNPPYITVEDKRLNEMYRSLYGSCKGTYALTVPFAERFFELAQPAGPDGKGCGYVGQITSNSFMKREFGTKLIEEYFAHKVELTEVIDTSGAYIPGHGTPTVILIGRRRSGRWRSSTVRTVRSVQGEPSAPEDASQAFVWRAIVEQIDEPGTTSKWVSVGDLDRQRYFATQPWILADGGLELVELIEGPVTARLRGAIRPPIGGAIRAGADEAFVRPSRATYKPFADRKALRQLVVGEDVRDWATAPTDLIWYPYGSSTETAGLAHELWPLRKMLQERRTFQGNMADAGLQWWNYMQHTQSTYVTPLAIVFAFMATHNHFVLDRGGKVFKQTAPVIKLPQESSEKDHLRLIGLLNSSAACFWLKMKSYPKGGDPIGGDGARVSAEPWSDRYEFTGGSIEPFPLPATYPLVLATQLDTLATQLTAASPSAVANTGIPTRERLREAKRIWRQTRAKTIALQEELDWQVYWIYNLLDEDLCTPEADVPELNLGERAFEIVLARRIAAGDASSEWFARHNSTPITELPSHWSEAYKSVVQRRIELIESNRAIGLIERPEYKRRWATEGWDKLEREALKSWLLDRTEAHSLWHYTDDNGVTQPRVLTPTQLADELAVDAEFAQVADLYAPSQPVQDTVLALVADEHVPALSALRYKPSGLKIRADWETCWDEQRKEDAAPTEAEKRKIRERIKVPPKYTSADFVRASYWQARGKLDVPKERFISISSTLKKADVLGWAGWDHREQAQALAVHIYDCEVNHAFTAEQLTPLLAALLELQPWLGQWHHEYDPAYDGSPADYFEAFRTEMQGRYGLTDDDLRNWRPSKTSNSSTRGRKKAS